MKWWPIGIWSISGPYSLSCLTLFKNSIWPLLSCHSGLSLSFSSFLLLSASFSSCFMAFYQLFRYPHSGIIPDIQISVEMPAVQQDSPWLAHLAQQPLPRLFPAYHLVIFLPNTHHSQIFPFWCVCLLSSPCIWMSNSQELFFFFFWPHSVLHCWHYNAN